jgi:hypothetical protein
MKARRACFLAATFLLTPGQSCLGSHLLVGQPGPWSLTAGWGARVHDAIESLLPDHQLSLENASRCIGQIILSNARPLARLAAQLP